MQSMSGVKQGCIMSGFLFLFAIDWIMNLTSEGRRTGAQLKSICDLRSTINCISQKFL